MKHWNTNLKSPGQRGVAHVIMPIVAFVVVFGAIGAYFLFRSEAATTTGTAIQSSGYSKCMDDKQGSHKVGAPVDIYACNGTAAQKWQVATASSAKTGATIEIYGSCVSLSGGNTAVNTPVVLAGCTGGSTQKWYQQSNGYLVNVGASNKCLTANNSTNNTQLVIRSCQGLTGQTWSGGPSLSTSGSGGGGGGATQSGAKGAITAGVGKNLCLTQSGATAEVATCSGSNTQQWVVTQSSSAIHEIENVGTNDCLDTNVAIAVNGSSATVTPCSQAKGSSAFWAVGTNSIQANGELSGGPCLDAATATTGSAVKVKSCNSSAEQTWTLPASKSTD